MFPDHQTCLRHLDELQLWLDRWQIKANDSKSVHFNFTMKRETCRPVLVNGHQLRQSNEANYLEMHLDRQLT